MRRMKILAQVEGLVRLGIGRDVAIRSVSDQVLESRATIYRWWALVKGQPRSEWYPRLMPGDSAGGRRVDVDPSVWAAFKADYLRMEAPAASACYERLQRIAEAKFWTVPSLKTLLRKIEREIHPDVLTLTRIGPHALKRSYPAQERDHSVFTALEAVNADGHKFDVFVEWPDGSKHRPIGLFWQDIYSGKILSWDIDKTENKDMVRVSFGRMVEKYGIPTYAYLDNGHAFTSKFISGGTTNRFRFKILDEDPVGCITACGTQINWATPYWGQAKPIERAFRDFCEHIAKHPECSGAYTGNSPSNKPENYGSRVVPLERFMAVMVREIAAHNARVGRRSKVCSGRSFDQVFKESYAKSMIPRASLSQRRMWLLAADKVTASRQDGAISFLGNRYWHRDLAMHRGERLVLRFETENLHGSVWVYDLANRLVCEAPCMEAAGFDSQEAAREHNRARNALIRLTKKVRDLELQLTAADLVQLLPDDLEEAPVPMPAAIGLAVGGGPSFPSRAEDQGTYEEMTERFSQSLELLKQAKATDPDFKY